MSQEQFARIFVIKGSLGARTSNNFRYTNLHVVSWMENVFYHIYLGHSFKYLPNTSIFFMKIAYCFFLALDQSTGHGRVWVKRLEPNQTQQKEQRVVDGFFDKPWWRLMAANIKPLKWLEPMDSIGWFLLLQGLWNCSPNISLYL